MSTRQQATTTKSSTRFFRLKPLVAGMKLVIAGSLLTGPGYADTGLPVPLHGGPDLVVESGQASLIASQQSAHHMVINETSEKAILDWNSFNVNAGNSVRFEQPDGSAVVLNRIFDQNPSEILGSITANGQVYLVNNNGFVFGHDSVVNANSFIASALDISNDALKNTLAEQFNDATSSVNGPAAALSGQSNLNANPTNPNCPSCIQVNAGAKIHANANGQIILAAPKVINNGAVTADQNAQIILVASQDKVYLQPASSDSPFSGLLVEVGTGGTVSNNGQIALREGNITLAGFAVNQNGNISSTTSVNVNGSVRLLARENIDTTEAVVSNALLPVQTVRSNGDASSVTFGPNSSVQIQPDANGGSAINEQAQTPSYVEVQANKIDMQGGSNIVAPSGKVNLTAVDNNNLLNLDFGNPLTPGHSRIDLESGAKIDVSGLKVELPMSANVAAVSVESFNLRDVPFQRGGVLYGHTVNVDIRNLPTVVDASSAPGSIKYSIADRLTTGGQIKLSSSGDVIVNTGATTDIAGGSVEYKAGDIITTQLKTSIGQWFDISQANPDQKYSDLAVAKSHQLGYTQGMAAGGLSIQSPQTVFAGQLLAGVTNKNYQPTVSVSGGSFSINSNLLNLASFSTQNIVFQQDAPVYNLGLQDAFPQANGQAADLLLSTAIINQSGISNLAAGTAGNMTLQAGAQINLPNEGSAALTAYHMDINGSIHAAGGNISLSVNSPNQTGGLGEINLASGALLDVSGGWVNDFKNPQTDAYLTAPDYINAGTVTVSANHDLNFMQGAAIAANGGAWLNTGARVAAGTAGNIFLIAGDATNNVNGTLELNGKLSADGLTNGGALNIKTTQAINIGPDNIANDLNLTLSKGNFAFNPDSVFSSITLASTLNTVSLEAGAALGSSITALTQQNRVLNNNFDQQDSGSSLAGFSHLDTLPESQRTAVNLGLSGATGVNINTGSSIYLDKAAKLSLNTTNLGSGIFIDGTLEALGGTISAVVKGSTEVFNPSLAIWLGNNADLNVTGVSRHNLTDSLGRVTGNVLNGGTVTLNAQSGALVMEPDASIKVSGTSDQLYMPVSGSNQQAPQYAVQTVGSNAGSINLSAAEGMVLEGGFSAHAGSASNSGGSLNVILDRNNRGEQTLGALPNNNLHIDVVQNNSDLLTVYKQELPGNISFGTALTQTMPSFGRAILSSEQVKTGGFADLQLKVPEQSDPQQGSVQFLGDVTLSTASSININAPGINWTALGNSTGTVNLNTGFLQMGSTTTDTQPGTSLTGGGHLQTNTDWTQLNGALLLSGFKQIDLHSNHDTRAVGYLNPDPSKRTDSNGNPLIPDSGFLSTAANLNLNASQIYPATLTNYTFTVGSAGGVINISGKNTDATPLSADGKLTFNADNINQDGVLKAPLGSIVLNTNSLNNPNAKLTFGDNSLTSVSADGKTIPFGVIANTLWEYPIGLKTNLVFNTTTITDVNNNPNVPGGYLPLGVKSLSFSSPAIDFNTGSIVNVAGGGNLLAAQFQPGLGGSSDYLANSKGFAILPSLGSSLAPYDPYLTGSSTTDPRQSVYLSGTDGLAAGYYTMLPAYDALLPGAYLITPQANSQDQLTTTYTTAGLPIVSGYEAQAGTGVHDSRYSGFLVETAAEVKIHSQYDIQTANKFFSSIAATNHTTVPILPEDSGQISIDASSQLALNATFLVNAPKGGKGAEMDISADNINVVVDPKAVAAPGSLNIAYGQLNKLNVASLLLGGTRQFNNTTGNTVVTVAAHNVNFETGVKLSMLDLLAVGKDGVDVQNGAKLASSGTVTTGESQLSISGDCAVLRLSADNQVTVNRSASTLLTLGSTNGLQVGEYLEGRGLAANTQITGIDPVHNQVTLSAAPTGVIGLGQNVAAYNVGATTTTTKGISTSNSFLTLADTTGLQVGDYLAGPGLAANTTITNISGHTVSISALPTANSTNSTNTIYDLTAAGGAYTASATGVVNIEQGASVSASKSILLDGSLSTQLNGDIAVQGGSLSLTANTINIGDNSGTSADALNLSNKILTNTVVSELLLNSRGAINFYGDVGQKDAQGVLQPIVFNNLTLNAAVLEGYGSDKNAALFKATNLVVENTLGATGGQSGNGSGSLGLSADQYTQGNGQVAVNGFNTTNINVNKEFSINGNSTLDVAGNLNLTAAAIDSKAGSTLAINASGPNGNVQINGNANSKNYTTSSEYGSAITISGNSITLENANILLPSGSLSLQAQTGDILVDGSGVGTGNNGGKSIIDLAGGSIDAGGNIKYTSGGNFSANAVAGKITLSSNSALNLAKGGGNATGGQLNLSAAAKSVELDGKLTANGASARLDVSGFSTNQGFSDLMTKLMTAGVSGDLYMRVRNDDIQQAQGETFSASNISLVADKGLIDIKGTLNADGSNNGGSISLAAGGTLTLEKTATLTAKDSNSTNGGKGGTITLSAVNPTNSGISIVPGAKIDLSGASGGFITGHLLNAGNSGGVLTMIAARTAENGSATDNGVNIQPIASGTVIGAREIDAVGLKQYTNTSGSITGTDIGNINTDTVNYINAAAQNPNIANLGSGVTLLPGVEIDRSGDLTLAANWDLSALSEGPNSASPAGQLAPIVGQLDLRATGNLNVNNSLVDGFDGNNVMQSGQSWGLQLVAGADVGSADSFATTTPTAQNTENLVIGSGASVHTGTGDIKLAAGGDITLTDNTATVFTAGSDAKGALANKAFPEQGGNVVMHAGGNINGAVNGAQFLTAWMPTIDAATIRGVTSLTSWGINASQFQENIGSFGGGNVSINAGGNINDLSVMMPTNGKEDSSHNVAIQGGGNMQISAGGNIAGGIYYLGMGNGSLNAGGQIEGSAKQFLNGPQLLVSGDQSGQQTAASGGGDTHLTLNAHQGISVTAVSDPMIINNTTTGFYTYTPNSSVAFNSLSGDIHLGGNTSIVTKILGEGSTVHPTQLYLSEVYPGTLNASAFNGSILLDSNLVLFPAASGNVNLFAKQNISSTSGACLNSAVGVCTLAMSDADPSLLPNAVTPLATAAGTTLVEDLFTADNINTNTFPSYDSAPVTDLHAVTPLHINDSQSASIATQSGDISALNINLPKQAIISAGQDLINTSIQLQHSDPLAANSLISAVRDLIFTSPVDSDGNISPNSLQYITVAGPGKVLIETGRDLNLGASAGIQSIGNLNNPNLSNTGAAVSIVVGLKHDAQNQLVKPNYVGTLSFLEDYLTKQFQKNGGKDNTLATLTVAKLTSLITQYMQQYSGNNSLSPTEALAQFANLSTSEQQPLAKQIDAILPMNVLVNIQQNINVLQEDMAAHINDPVTVKNDKAAIASDMAAITFFNQNIPSSLLTTKEATFVNYAYQYDQIDGLITQVMPTDATFATSDITAAYKTLALDDRLQIEPQLNSIVAKVFFNELKVAGSAAAVNKSAGYAGGFAAIDALFPSKDSWQGNLSMVYSQIQTKVGGDINLFVPGGQVNVGDAVTPAAGSAPKTSSELGIVAQGQGSINSFTNGNFNVNTSRVFTLGGGDVELWSSEGDIDAGKGAKTALSVTVVPPKLDPKSGLYVYTPPVITNGSGIRTAGSANVIAGNVYLFAPKGVVNAGEAGIGGTNVTISATAVLGAQNIQATGISTGVPPASGGGLTSGLSGSSSLTSSLNQVAQASEDDEEKKKQNQAKSMALGILSVELLGFGD